MFGHVDHVGEVQEQGYGFPAVYRSDSHPVADRASVRKLRISPVECEADVPSMFDGLEFAPEGVVRGDAECSSCQLGEGSRTGLDDASRLRAEESFMLHGAQLAVKVGKCGNAVKIGQIDILTAYRRNQGLNQHVAQIARRVEPDV